HSRPGRLGAGAGGPAGADGVETATVAGGAGLRAGWLGTGGTGVNKQVGTAWRRGWLPGMCALLLWGCSGLPTLETRTASQALGEEESAGTALGRALAPELVAHPGLNGIWTLLDAQGAFAARVLLARTAQRTLDVQYYIWRQDMTGTLPFEALHEAAERDVRVLLLLDDNNTRGLDAVLAALDAHPNMEVRLFNPYVQRKVRLLGLLTDFSRANRRMHNKSFTADNQATVLGGRNVGDEYFG